MTPHAKAGPAHASAFAGLPGDSRRALAAVPHRPVAAPRTGARLRGSAVASGLLALFCLGIAGVFAGEVLKHGRTAERQGQQIEAAAAELAAMNPDEDDRSRSTALTRQLSDTEHLAQLKRTIQTEAAIGFGAVLAFAGFGVAAVRAGRPS